ncbi:transposase [Streptosporangium sp. NPDC006013]|uniref:transposase n=1 Tax=Streptosporangium sp. NPDC006013 TaxID=3155596 RepID=UPI0033B13210
MARGFRRIDRDQQFLLPVDMREWLPDDHVVWVLLEVVEHLDVTALEARYAQAGPGRRAYDPRMLLSLLIYAYSAGVRSSRQIERLCRTDVAMRVICGLMVPDHTVIARFRQRHQDSVRDLFTQVLLICAKAGLGRLGIIAVDGTKIAADASKKATCRRQWLQQQVDEILARAATEDADEDAALGPGERGDETPQRLRGRRDREERLKRALAEVIAEEAERGLDAESAAAKERAFIEATRAGRSDVGSRPAGADPVAIAEARLQAAQGRLAEEVAAKREQIAVMRERIRRFEAGEGLKPHLGPFSFDENRGREVARAKRWVARAEQELVAARAGRASPPPECGQADLSPVPGGGRHGPRGITTKDERPVARRNVTDPDSRLMHDRNGGAIQGYNAQLAVSDDGLILSPEVVQDANDRRQLRPMSQAAVTAALLVHQERCRRQCPEMGGCCIAVSAVRGSRDHLRGCGDTGCPCLADWIGTLLFDAGYWTQDNLTAPGPDRLIAPGKSGALPQPGQHCDSLPEDADPATVMVHRLATEEGAALYKRRGATVEPVNGHLKDRTALRRFARRGLAACQAELTFAAMVLNLGKLCRLDPARRSAALTT